MNLGTASGGVFSFDEPPDLLMPDMVMAIGGKAANLCVMAHELGLPVPPGFVIGTGVCGEYLARGWPDGLDEPIRHHLERVEEAVGRRFGDADNPLLVSVRSGAPVSMPGMMDTILNLGLNDATEAGLAAASGDAAFARSCRDRFNASFLDIVGGDAVPAEPWRQLRAGIEAVFRSWNSERAQSYRSHEGIPDDLGTAVIVQAMVFGNWGGGSATGAVFTRNPATGERGLYGDVMFEAQGEDVVAGTHQPEPISALRERMPAVARELEEYAAALEHHYASVCDIEFTVERGRLWMLQTRVGKLSPQAALRIAIEMAEDDSFPLTRADAVARVARHLQDPPTVAGGGGDAPPARALARGLGASPGMATGAIVTTPEAALAKAGEGSPVILVRRQTSPDDVPGMAKSAGILTTTGGLTSHAAVVARGWGVPAVVGAAAVRVDNDDVTIGAQTFGAGDLLTIDGATGEVFAGEVRAGGEVAPEAATLLSWAAELGIVIPEAAGGERSSTAGDEDRQPGEELVAEDLLRPMLIKGFVDADGVAAALVTESGRVAPLLERLAAEGLAETFGDMFQLTSSGSSLGTELIGADREHWGAEHAAAALDAFLPLDERMKNIVTAWQMREFQGQQVLNDHSDPEHDAAVLAEFAALHADAAPWVGSLAEHLARLARYRVRLDLAADRVSAGDHAYIASPQVDSYHGIWFELHEDLILLAGRTRSEEVDAGRA